MSSPRYIGVALVLTSALVFSTAGLFVKGVIADAWSIIFWRGISAVIFTSVWILWRGNFRREFSGMGRVGIAAGLVAASGTVAFIPAFKLTSIANVSLIYAAAPFVATVIAWFWMRERPSRVVLIASLVAFSGVLLIVGGSLGSVNLRGDLLALWMTIAMSVYVCIYRRYPLTPAAGPAVLSSIVLLPVCLKFSDPFAESLSEILIMCSFGLVFAIASVTLAEGARRLPASETSLLSALETPLAPVWAWMLFSEMPAVLTVVGGVIIFASVLGSQMFESRQTIQRVADQS